MTTKGILRLLVSSVILLGALPALADLQADAAKHVHQLDDTHYAIDRAFVDGVAADPTPFMASARLVPSVRDGKSDGFRIFAIRPGTVFALLGLQNGDTLMAVNGIPLTDPDKLLQAYAQLKTATEIDLQLERAGKPISITYSIK